MVRLHFEAREPIDYPKATEVDIGPSGAVTLYETEIGQATDPQSFRPVSVIKGRRWLATWWPRSGLLHAENLDLVTEEKAGPEPALEEVPA